MISDLMHVIAERRRVRQGVKVLSGLSDHQLYDIGFTRKDVQRYAATGTISGPRP